MPRLRPLFIVALAVTGARPLSAESTEDPVVLTVGQVDLGVSDVERRLAALPPFQRNALGSTPAEIRRRFVETALVPELLFGAAADQRELENAPWLQTRINEAYRRALYESIREKLVSTKAITEADIRNYYEAHLDHFERPQRIQIWRILVDDTELAKRIIEKARGVDGPKAWKELAREHSLDKATQMRGGSLGFVYPDGRTNVPQVRVDPNLFAAAKQVRDGEVVPNPVKEGDRLAVVWRRGSIPPVKQSPEQQRTGIEQILLRERIQTRLDELVQSLRKQHLSDFHPDLLELLPEDTTAPRPSTTPAASTPSSSSGDPMVRPVPGGNR